MASFPAQSTTSNDKKLYLEFEKASERSHLLSPSVPALLSNRLAAAMSHPTRLYALTVLNERTATAREIADGLGLEINRVMHHINRLRDLELIELVAVKPAAGGRVSEHHYRATDIAYVDDEAWAELTPKEKADVSFSILRMMSEDLNVSVGSGTFFDPDDNHLSRNPMRLDSQGWREVIEYLDGVVSGLKKIQDRVDDRLSADEEPMLVKVEILQLRSPKQDRYPETRFG